MSEAATEYHDIPTRPYRDGWVTCLRDRLPFSFKTVEQVKSDGKWAFVLGDPNPPQGSAIFHGKFNLWSRALAFYAAGKIVDATLALNNELNTYRGLLLKSQMPFASNNDALASELQRQCLLVNRNRLDCERAVTTLIMQALEFVIKAMCVHCNYLVNGAFQFQEGHGIHCLYESLPFECRREIDSESRVFWIEFGQERQKAIKVIKAMMHSGHEQMGCFVSKKYFALLVGSGPWIEGPCPDGGWLIDFLKGAGKLTDHRYGPVPRRGQEFASEADGYSTEAVERVLLLGTFFFEHLFGVSDPKNQPWHCGP